MLRRRLIGAVVALILVGVTASSAAGATTIPTLWTAGGLSAGTDSAGQAERMAVDAWGNVAIVSGPAQGSLLAVTSYTSDGELRWQSTVSPGQGTFRGDWVAAAPNGDFVAVGHNVTSTGKPIAITLVRFASHGTLLWRVDLALTFPAVGRLLVDAAGDAYLAFNSVGDGQDIQLHKYSSSGALLWAKGIGTGTLANDIATSLALSPDGADVAVTGSIQGGATWITALYDSATGVRRWLVTAAEGVATRDVVVDGASVYVTGQGNVGIEAFLTVVAYDRGNGTRLWRTDRRPPDATGAAGLRMDLAPDGSLVVAGQASRGFLDWYTVGFDTAGAARWEAVRDGGLNTDEIPRAVRALADGTTVVTGRGGPNLPGGYIPGVTAGYGPAGTLLWEAFSRMETVWADALPNGDVCATGGYDALITCWRVAGVLRAEMSFSPSTGPAPLSVTFDGSGSTSPSGTVTSWAWAFGDGGVGTGPVITHLYTSPGTYTATLTVTDSTGASSKATGTIVAKPLPPLAPSNLTASLSGTLVVLTWQDNSSNESGFSIERCEGAGCTNFASVASQWPDFPSYSDYTALSGRTYRYRVRAYNDGGYSPYSNIASLLAGTPLPPPAPSGLTATALTRRSIGLTWTNGSSGQTEVRVERCQGSGCTNFSQVAAVAGTATTFTDLGLTPWTTYRYRVRAHGALGDSPYSNTASARTKR
jgi:chitodextrinase